MYQQIRSWETAPRGVSASIALLPLSLQIYSECAAARSMYGAFQLASAWPAAGRALLSVKVAARVAWLRAAPRFSAYVSELLCSELSMHRYGCHNRADRRFPLMLGIVSIAHFRTPLPTMALAGLKQRRRIHCFYADHWTSFPTWLRNLLPGAPVLLWLRRLFSGGYCTGSPLPTMAVGVGRAQSCCNRL